MIEMFKYLTGTLERKEQRTWKLYAMFGLISPIVDIFSFSVIIYIINRVVQDNQVSDKLIIFKIGRASCRERV